MELTEEEPLETDRRVPKANPMLAIAYNIANSEHGEKYVYCLEQGTFFVYVDGVWEKIFDEDLLGRITIRFREQIAKYPIGTRKQVVDNLKTIVHVRLNKFDQSSFLNMENGMIDVYGNNVLKHEPKYFSTIRIPYKYDLLGKCDLWIKTITEIFEGDKEKVDVLQEFFGYCLTRETKQEKSILLLGESRSGKSTILNTLRNMLGTSNCSSVALKHIDNQQYTPMLIGKMVNIDSDVSAKALEFEAQFKTITSGEPVTCNDKYIKAFDFNPFCKLVMAANEFPRITDHSSAFYKRLILLSCDRVFLEEEQNKNLKTDLLGEMGGILNWSIQGLQRLIKRGRFEQKQFMREAIESLREESNPIDVFFKEKIRVEIKEDNYIEKGELYIKYVEWCKVNGCMPLSTIKFGKYLYNKYSRFTERDSQVHSTGRRIWKNLIYINNDIPNQQQVNWQE